ncbi:MAG TPA: TolC family protein, partial [Phenylobacterium sp.]|nr:TolC family protein [Phenylobacterium sp.]
WTAPDFALSDFTRPADLPLSLPSTLVRQRPDIQAAEAELHAATAEVGVAAAALYPDIRLSANLTQGTIHPEDILRYDSTGWSLAGNLAAPLFNGGRLKANKRAAEASARAALARYNGVVLRAFVEVADALSALAEDDKAIAALTRVQQSQENRLKDARAAYELGGGTLLSVVQAQRDLAKSRRDVVQALGRKDADLVMLLTATATGWKPAAS